MKRKIRFVKNIHQAFRVTFLVFAGFIICLWIYSIAAAIFHSVVLELLQIPWYQQAFWLTIWTLPILLLLALCAFLTGKKLKSMERAAKKQAK